MEIKNYCFIGLGKGLVLETMKLDICELANSNPKFVMNTGILIVTFSSTFKAIEIKDFINQIDGRTFFLYEIDNETSAVNLPMPYYEQLFKEIDEANEYKFNLSWETKETSIVSGSTTTQNTIIEIGNISDVEKMKLIDELIDKGLENLTNNEREMLNKLSEMP